MLNFSGSSYYGFGTATGTAGVNGYKRATTSSNFKTMSRNIAAGYSSDIEIIQKYLEDGKTDKAIEKYESLMDDIKTTTSGNYNFSMTDSEIESILKSAYEATTGTSMLDSIETNTCGSFMTGLKQSIPIFGLFCNDTSEAEAIARLTGDEVSWKDTVLEIAGMAVGTVAFGLIGGGIFKGASALKGILSSGEKAAKAGNWLSKILKGSKAAEKIKNAGAVAVGTTTAVVAGASAAGNALIDGDI